jgi:hypothetical protein
MLGHRVHKEMDAVTETMAAINHHRQNLPYFNNLKLYLSQGSSKQTQFDAAVSLWCQAMHMIYEHF